MNNLLMAGGMVTVSDPLSTSTGDVLLTLLSDGNLVLQRPVPGTVLWQTSTSGQPGTHAIMQADGNFVLYDADGTALWATGTWNNPGAWIILQDDGRLVVYSPSGQPLWASSLPSIMVAGQQLNPGDAIYSSAGRVALELGLDGNLVLSRADTSTTLWQSDTAGQPGVHAIMQTDGNFVLYDADGTALWATGTWNNPGAWIVLQDDGNLVVYTSAHASLWASDTVQTWPPMSAIESVSLVSEQSSEDIFLIVGDTKFLIESAEEFAALGFDSSKVRTVADGLLDGFKSLPLHAVPETKASDVWFDFGNSWNLYWGTMLGNSKSSAAIARKDVLVAGWFSDYAQPPNLPFPNNYPLVNYVPMGQPGGGVEDIHYDIMLDAQFIARMYGPGGLSNALTDAVWPGNPNPGNPPGPVAFPFATDPPLEPGGAAVVTFNSWILPSNGNADPGGGRNDVHGELNCWHVYDVHSKSFSENWRGRGPAPAGWIVEDWEMYPEFGGDIADADTWFPFDPLDPESLGHRITGGDYVLLRGTIWQENNHGLDQIGFEKPPTVGQDGVTEMHPPDWVCRVGPPNPNARKTILWTAWASEDVTGPPISVLQRTVLPDFEPSSPTGKLRVRSVEQLIDPRFTKPGTIATLTEQVWIDHIDVDLVIQPDGTDQARFKAAWLVGWSETDENDRVWVNDELPAGAVEFADNETWDWEGDNVFYGSLAHRSALKAGMHQHGFTGAARPLVCGEDDVLFAMVFLDPDNPPDEIMLQWQTTEWLSPAYWGANLLAGEEHGTSPRRYMGPLPASGEWIRLSVPAREAGVGINTPIHGMSFTLSGGRATWDYAGAAADMTVSPSER